MIVNQTDGSVRDEVVSTGSNVEQTIGGSLPAKANLMGISDGTNIRAMTGNTTGPLLASTARTASVTTANVINYNARGIQFLINTTVASGTGGLQIKIFGVDSSGFGYLLNTPPAAIIATGLYVYELYPGASGASGQVIQRISGALPRIFFVTITAGDTTSYTYALTYSLII